MRRKIQPKNYAIKVAERIRGINLLIEVLVVGALLLKSLLLPKSDLCS